ncbi:MAG: hypothetical protein QG673_1621 [Pseudomonadota bacterium]|nr:hypothetical protein [Pseudomonadota bacterium]
MTSIARVPFVSPAIFEERQQKPSSSASKAKVNQAEDNTEVDSAQAMYTRHREDLQAEDTGEDRATDNEFLAHLLKHNRNMNTEQNSRIHSELMNRTEDKFAKEITQEAKYIELQDLGELVKYFEGGMSLGEVDTLLSNIVQQDDGSAEAGVAEFFNTHSFNPAQIYLALNYMYDTLVKKYKGKTKLLALIMKLIKQYESQESAYLFEFFSILRQPSLKANTALANGIAMANSGNMAVVSVKSMFGFIKDSLGGKFENLVSTCMKNRAHILKRLTKDNISFEQKSELAEYLKFEKTLIAVHSTYILATKLRDLQNKTGIVESQRVEAISAEEEEKKRAKAQAQARRNRLLMRRKNTTTVTESSAKDLNGKNTKKNNGGADENEDDASNAKGSNAKNSGENDKEQVEQVSPMDMIKLTSDDYKLVVSLSAFAESSAINEMSINNLCKQIISSKIQNLPVGFLNKLILFYSRVPVLIYSYSEAQQEKIVHGLRSIIASVNARKNKPTFGFLKKRDVDSDIVKYNV